MSYTQKNPKILVLAGSLRVDSTNKKLATVACEIAKSLKADVTYIDLKDYPLPIYDGDIEMTQGLPENALKLKGLMYESDGFIIASPEYNSSISGVLKNVIDWTSRQKNPEETYLSCFIDKVALLLSASPSPLGGLRGLVHLRSILSNIYTIVLPDQKTLPNSLQAFDEKGSLINDKDFQDVKKCVTKFLDTVIKLQQDK